MTYSLDFRKHVLSVKKQEGLTYLQTSKRFKIGTTTLTRWNNKLTPQATRNKPATKINMDNLKKDVQLYPDSYIYERAKRFNVSVGAIFNALKRLGVTYKKNTAAPQSRRREAQIVPGKNKQL